MNRVQVTSEHIRAAARGLAVEMVNRVDCTEGVLVAWVELIANGYMTPDQLRARIAEKVNVGTSA